MKLTNIPVYDGEMIHDRFAYKYFRENTSPLGNIVAFRAPMDVPVHNMIDLEDVLEEDTITSRDAINFCWEIPNLCALGAVAFQRLFNTHIASILSSKIINKPIAVDGDDLMVPEKFTGHDGVQYDEGKCSVSITYSKYDVALGHTGINVVAGTKAPGFAYSTNMNDEQCEEFMRLCIEQFYFILGGLFTATTKIIIK